MFCIFTNKWNEAHQAATIGGKVLQEQINGQLLNPQPKQIPFTWQGIHHVLSHTFRHINTGTIWILTDTLYVRVLKEAHTWPEWINMQSIHTTVYLLCKQAHPRCTHTLLSHHMASARLTGRINNVSRCKQASCCARRRLLCADGLLGIWVRRAVKFQSQAGSPVPTSDLAMHFRFSTSSLTWRKGKQWIKVKRLGKWIHCDSANHPSS